MYSPVINYIKQRIEISREEIEETLKYSDFKKYKKGDYILRAGEHCRVIGFLNRGFIVTTFVDETGNEKGFLNLNMRDVFLLIRRINQ
jgi:hypothetical protein